MGDVDAIIADCADLIAAHGLDLETVRDVVAKDIMEPGTRRPPDVASAATT